MTDSTTEYLLRLRCNDNSLIAHTANSALNAIKIALELDKEDVSIFELSKNGKPLSNAANLSFVNAYDNLKKEEIKILTEIQSFLNKWQISCTKGYLSRMVVAITFFLITKRGYNHVMRDTIENIGITLGVPKSKMNRAISNALDRYYCEALVKNKKNPPIKYTDEGIRIAFRGHQSKINLNGQVDMPFLRDKLAVPLDNRYKTR